MLHIARLEGCRDCFIKLQNRLLQFTVSHFMDSRVAATVSEILFEMLKSELVPSNLESRDDHQQSPPTRANSSLAAPSPIRVTRDDDTSQLSAATADAAVSDGALGKNGVIERAADSLGSDDNRQSLYATMNGVGEEGHSDDGIPVQRGKQSRKRKNHPDSPEHHHLNNGVSDNGNHIDLTSVKKHAQMTSEEVKEKLRNNLIHKQEEVNKNALAHSPYENDHQTPNGVLVHSPTDAPRMNGASTKKTPTTAANKSSHTSHEGMEHPICAGEN